MTSPNPAEEDGQLREELGPWEEWAITPQASKPEGAFSSGVMTIMWKQLPPTHPGFLEPLATKSGPPSLKDMGSSVGVLKGAWLDLISLGSMQMVITKNTL